MCGFTFTVFLSAFQLLPTAPFRIEELGGSTFQQGLFLACLTYASAFSAPFTGAIADRIGRRRTLIIASAVISVCSIGYALTPSVVVMLALVLVHGVFWSGLLAASAAHLTSLLPERRRAEGMSYWGLSSIAAIAVAPPIAFWILHHGGWTWICVSCGVLNVTMCAIAFALKEQAHEPVPSTAIDAGAELALLRGRASSAPARSEQLLEWRVLILSITLFLYSFSYGAITTFSAVYADTLGISPKSIYLTTLAIVILLTRPMSGTLADRIGYRRVFMPCLVLIAGGVALLTIRGTLSSLVASAIVFGLGFGTAYPVFVAYVMKDIAPRRRGAAFGAILAAFDTGIGTGSMTAGYLIQRFGFPAAFGVAAALSAIALPYFVVADGRLRRLR
jgi:MFS family permease